MYGIPFFGVSVGRRCEQERTAASIDAPTRVLHSGFLYSPSASASQGARAPMERSVETPARKPTTPSATVLPSAPSDPPVMPIFSTTCSMVVAAMPQPK